MKSTHDNFALQRGNANVNHVILQSHAMLAYAPRRFQVVHVLRHDTLLGFSDGSATLLSQLLGTVKHHCQRHRVFSTFTALCGLSGCVAAGGCQHMKLAVLPSDCNQTQAARRCKAVCTTLTTLDQLSPLAVRA